MTDRLTRLAELSVHDANVREGQIVRRVIGSYLYTVPLSST